MSDDDYQAVDEIRANAEHAAKSAAFIIQKQKEEIESLRTALSEACEIIRDGDALFVDEHDEQECEYAQAWAARAAAFLEKWGKKDEG